MRTVTRRTFLALLTASLLFVTAIPSLHAAAPVERSGRVTLLQLNDLYDIMPVEKGKKGGLARIATLRDKLAEHADWSHALVVCDAVFSMTGRVMDLRRLAELGRHDLQRHRERAWPERAKSVERRPDLVRLRYQLSVASQRLDHLVGVG